MRDCPVFHIEVTREAAVEFFVAAETAEEARTIAEEIATREIDWWSVYCDHDATVLGPEVERIDHRGIKDCGIWIPSEKTWVFSFDDVPQLPLLPDPNQGVLPLDGVGAAPWGDRGRAENVAVNGGVL